MTVIISTNKNGNTGIIGIEWERKHDVLKQEVSIYALIIQITIINIFCLRTSTTWIISPSNQHSILPIVSLENNESSS